jgi:multiple sugar transport system substrate-binding protein
VKFNRLKRLFSIGAVISMMTVTLAACGGNETPTTGTTGSTGGAAATPTTATSAGGAATPTTAMAGGEATPTTAMAGGEATATTATTGSTGGGGGGTITLPANCSNVSLSYWNGLTGPDGQFMQQLVTQFNASQQQVQVKMTAQSDYNTKLQTAAASDTLPNVAIINEDQIATQAFNHVIRSEDDLVKQLGYGQGDFPAAAWTLAQVAGHTYGIPLSIVPMTMYYNKDLFQKAGVSAPPTNDTEFQDAAQKLTTGGNNGFMITSGFPVQQIFQQLLHQFGGTEYSADGTQATWNSDAGVKALQWMVDAQKKYSKPKLPVDADLNGFKAGTVGMIWNGIWQTSNVTGSAVSFDGEATAPPQIGPNPATWAGMALLSLPVHKKGEDQCADTGSAMFIKYVLDNSATWAKGGSVPALNSVRNGPDIAQMHPQAELAKAVENPVFPPPIAGISDAFAPLGDAVGAIMGGTATDIKGTLDTAANRANQILKQNAQKFGTTP